MNFNNLISFRDMKTQLTLEQKVGILGLLEKNEKIKDIAKNNKVTPRTIFRIKQSKYKIEEFTAKDLRKMAKIKKMRQSAVPNMEKALYAWFLNERKRHNIVTNEILCEKAKLLHESLDNNVRFNASIGWLQKFKKRHNIRLLKICGERLSANEAAVKEFIDDFKQKVNDLGLCRDQIYNADETGLIIKDLNSKTLVMHAEKNAPGRKNSKERITIMPCINAAGTHKVPLMVIGKAKNPRCFKDCVLPEIHYRSSKNAWQTRQLFEEWFTTVFIPNVTEHLKRSGLPIKALLIVDNASCHSTTISTENFTVIFIPPNTTSLIQPLDQQVIKVFKQLYRKNLLLNLLKHGGEIIDGLKKINLKEVLFLVVESWRDVQTKIIVNAWTQLIPHVEFSEMNHLDDKLNETCKIFQLYRKLLPNSSLNESEIMEWANGNLEKDVEATFMIDDDNINNTIEQPVEENETGSNINNVISAFNKVIEWASDRPSISLSDIFVLRKLSNIATMDKYSK